MKTQNIDSEIKVNFFSSVGKTSHFKRENLCNAPISLKYYYKILENL